jgi:hypothetical protein
MLLCSDSDDALFLFHSDAKAPREVTEGEGLWPNSSALPQKRSPAVI